MGPAPLLWWRSSAVLSVLALGERREEARVCLAGQDARVQEQLFHVLLGPSPSGTAKTAGRCELQRHSCYQNICCGYVTGPADREGPRPLHPALPFLHSHGSRAVKSLVLAPQPRAWCFSRT